MTVSQSAFRKALLDPAVAAPTGLIDSTGHPALARFNVYRNNVAVSLTEALHTGFPVLAKLLGKENMDGLAGLFLRAHPPETPLLMFYGDALPAFIADLPQLAHLGYLPDVARLELALRRSYHAADADPIDPAQLGRLTPDALMHTTVTFAPSARLLRSDWPVFDIWRFNTQDDAQKPVPGAQDVLVTRAAFDPVPSLLAPGGAEWIAALMRGRTIEQAMQAAQAIDPDFDPTGTLTLLLSENALTSLKTKD